jgi:hypothetical protein
LTVCCHNNGHGAYEKGEHIYRYGDASRSAAKKDSRGYMLFTCNAPHVFIQAKAPDKATLVRATVVKPGDPQFADLDRVSVWFPQSARQISGSQGQAILATAIGPMAP